MLFVCTVGLYGLQAEKSGQAFINALLCVYVLRWPPDGKEPGSNYYRFAGDVGLLQRSN